MLTERPSLLSGDRHYTNSHSTQADSLMGEVFFIGNTQRTNPGRGETSGEGDLELAVEG